MRSNPCFAASSTRIERYRTAADRLLLSVKPHDAIPAASSVPPSSVGTALVLFLKFWLPVLLWLAVIFTFSGDAGSTRHTSRFIGPLLRWLNPNISDGSVERIQFVIRKTAHATEYGVLALLVWRALRQPRRGDRRPWNRRQAGLAFAVAAVFAMSDEWHQSFVRDRQGQFVDVALDCAGAAAALGALWTFGRWRRRW